MGRGDTRQEGVAIRHTHQRIEIETERLWVVALNWEEVGLCLGDKHAPLVALSHQLQMTPAPELISETGKIALRSKYEKMARLLSRHHPWYTYWLMVTKQDRCGVGMVGFKGKPTSKGDVEIGYATAPDYRDNGYMTEAVAGMVQWAFDQPYCEAVVAETMRENVASHRVLEKVGMVIDGNTKKMIRWRLNRQNNPAGISERWQRSP
jgi:RimJ/RimL family protein N-acetyltransferase